MDLRTILCVFVISLIFQSDFFLCSCEAVAPCPVRAIPVSAPELESGFKCVCERNYYGKNCRFKARNKTIEADGWLDSANNAVFTWLGQYDEQYHLSVRRVRYENRSVTPSKWMRANIVSLKIELTDLNPTGIAFNPGSQANFTANIHLAQLGNYEVYLVKIANTGSVNGSVSLFLDTSNTPDVKNNTNNNSEQATCGWLECPGQFFHITSIMEDFGKPCFTHGIIVAVPMTIFSGLLIGALVYVVVRQAKRNSSMVKNTMEKESNNNVEETCEPDTSKCFQQENSSVRSFVIDIPEYEIWQESIYKTIQEIKPPSIHWTDEESLSDSGSSLTTVTSLSTLSVSSLREGEVDPSTVADI